MKVALLQFGAGEDKAANLKKAFFLSQQALDHGAKFILLPEVFNFRGDPRDKDWFAKAPEEIPGPSTEVFFRLAKKHRASFLLGSIIEKAGKRHAYNTSIYIDTQGHIAAKYRKINLFDARIGDKIVNEAHVFRAGSSPQIISVAGLRVGLSICYDLRFSGLYRQYARQGVEALVVPSCFTRKTGQAHWEVLLRARAIETLSYVLAPAQIGRDSRGVLAHGHSMIVSPWGEILAEGSGAKEEIIYGSIDLREVQRARKILPGIIKTGDIYA